MVCLGGSGKNSISIYNLIGIVGMYPARGGVVILLYEACRACLPSLLNVEKETLCNNSAAFTHSRFFNY